MLELSLALLSAYVLAYTLTPPVRRYAMAGRLLDIPGPRSSHRAPTPRGGGLATVGSFALVTSVLALFDLLDERLLLGVLPPALLVAAVGLRDDHGHVAMPLRLLAHLAAATWVVLWLPAPSSLPWPLGAAASTLVMQVLAVLGMVWFLNLFNFMDGIDGIAASEAVFLGAAGGVMAMLGGQADIAAALWILAAAALGFLHWNWPPARIFMGDVGSGFLGLGLAILAYAGLADDPATLWPWAILAAVFVGDATLTLLRRLLRGVRVAEAHRSHAYQHAAQRWGHRRVSGVVIAINLLWLAPLAWAAWRWPDAGLAITWLAYMPLLMAAYRLGAGVDAREEPEEAAP